jgi:hypothetical protein
MSSKFPESIRVREARCECGHHPLEHELAHSLLTGDPARCSRCECHEFRKAPGSPPAIELE